MSKQASYSFNNVRYYVDIDQEKRSIYFKIENPEKTITPKYLYKYYSFNQFSIDALVRNYFFASHPMMLNDKYDCSGDLIDYSKLDIWFYLNFLANELHLFSHEKVKELFHSDNKWILERTVADLNQTRLFMKFGILSFTENEKDVLMWAYYSQNSGFVLKLDTSLLPKNLFGPFPINYVDHFEKIDISNYGPELSILYQTNVKQELWRREDEWRYLSYNENGKFHPFYWKFDLFSRNVYYNLKAVKEIILGYDFFNPTEIDFNQRTQEYDVINFNSKFAKKNKKLKKKLLNYIISNDISCKQIVRHRYKYLLDAKDVPVERISPNRFKVYNIFKQVEA